MIVPVRFGFYAILTDPLMGYEYMTEMLVANEIRFIQLRMKETEDSMVLKTAEKLRKITADTRSLFIINDSPEIARAIDADGVHIGQGDMAFKEARAIVGPGKILGISTRDPGQVQKACTEGPDYIGMGPVFPTPLKVEREPAIGLDGLNAMLKACTLPSVALGSINETNLRDVLKAGAVNFCSIRPITQSREPEKALKALLKIYNENNYNN